MIRPERIGVEPHGAPARTGCPGLVERSVFLGSAYELHVRVLGGDLLQGDGRERRRPLDGRARGGRGGDARTCRPTRLRGSARRTVRRGAGRRERGCRPTAARPGPDRALHVARHPLVGAADVERRVVRAVQRADAQNVAGPPLRHVAARVGIDRPEPDVDRLGSRAAGPYIRSELVAHSLVAVGLGRARAGMRAAPAARAPTARRRAAARSSRARARPPTRPFGADVRPDRARVDRDDLRRERVPLSVAATRRRSGSTPSISSLASDADGERADDGSARSSSPEARRTRHAARRHRTETTSASSRTPLVRAPPRCARRPRRSPPPPASTPSARTSRTSALADGRRLPQLGEQRACARSSRRQAPSAPDLEPPDRRRQRIDRAQPASDRDAVEARGVAVRPGVVRIDRRRRARPRAARRARSRLARRPSRNGQSSRTLDTLEEVVGRLPRRRRCSSARA